MSYEKLNIEKKLILAPMAEISDKPFRSIAKKFGAGLTYTQMISAKGIVKREFAALRMAVFSQKELPIGVQLLGKDPNLLSESIKIIKEYKPSTIDLNCGCPVPRVMKMGFGASLLENPTGLSKVIRAMKKAAGDTPISIKIRLGASKNTVLENTKIIEGEGADFVILHPKFAYESSEDKPHLEWLGKVKNNISIPLIGNGFIFSGKQAKDYIEKYGVNALMIARGAIGNPYIFKEYETLKENREYIEPNILNVKDDFFEHLKLIQIDNGENNAGLNNAKKHAIWYFKRFNGIKYLVPKVLKADSYSQLEIILNEHSERVFNNEFVSLGDANEINNQFLNRILFWLVRED